MAAGKVILVHGPSSVGKSTLSRALQARLDEPFLYLSIDHFRDAGMLPLDRVRSGEFDWPSLRPAFFEGFHRCLPALAAAGNNLLVEHIVETEAWLARLVKLLASFDVFFVGLHCPLPELERREAARGDRPLGDARRDFETVHGFARYDLELDATQPPEANVAALLSAWQARTPPSAFQQLSPERGRPA
ncbi:MAG: chloramphenicol phosphotransferase CPT family protein [Proteobacteria bacterium]|nr:chloramphenicol phosphotransferase CPT family protein [Pseudomonadota bacterium]